MDAVEFIQAHERLLVDIVRKWTAEHCEVSKADESRNVLELMVALTDKVDRMAERIKVAENMIEESRCVMDAAFGEVDERRETKKEANEDGCAGGGIPGGRL